MHVRPQYAAATQSIRRYRQLQMPRYARYARRVQKRHDATGKGGFLKLQRMCRRSSTTALFVGPFTGTISIKQIVQNHQKVDENESKCKKKK